MSYASDHLAWQQRVGQERTAAFKFNQTHRNFGQVSDYYNYVIDHEHRVQEQNQVLPPYKDSLMSPQQRLSNSKKFQFTDKNGAPVMNGQQSHNTPRIKNKQSYTFGGQTNIAQSPLYENPMLKGTLHDDPQGGALPKSFYSKQAYVKRQKSSSALSTKSSQVSKNFKTFYPPNYDKDAGHMQKLPKIQRFNEEIDTLSVVSKSRPQDTQQPLTSLLSKAKSSQNIMMNQVLKSHSQNNDHLLSQQQLQTLNNLTEGQEPINEDEREHQSELYDEINSLYDNENQKGDDDEKRSVYSSVSKARSNVSKKSQVIITSLEKQLNEEREARRRLEEELNSIKQLSLQLLKNAKKDQ